jgi:hypothetical protein
MQNVFYTAIPNREVKGLQGNSCNENRDPAMRTRVSCNENRELTYREFPVSFTGWVWVCSVCFEILLKSQ